MIPRWQLIAIGLLVLLSAAAELVLFPNSYAHAYLWGECRHNPMPAVCNIRFGDGLRGRAGTP